MKNSYLYLTVLGATVLASCSNEIESLEKTVQTNNKYASELVDVSKDFTLIGGYENPNGETRAEWNFDGANRAATSNWAWRSTDVIGAAWVGKNYNADGTVNHDFSANLDGKVLSNYEFGITKYSAATVTTVAGMTAANASNDANAWTDRVKGTFQTNNLKMFGGDYIVYTPYDEDLTEEGYITMKAPEELEQTALSDQGMFQATANEPYFNAYGYSTKMVGGQPEIGANIAAGRFSMRPLNRIVGVRLTTKETVTNVKKLYIYSESGEIFTQNGLSARKIAQGEIEVAAAGEITTLPYEEDNDKIKTTTAVRTTLTTAGNVTPNTLSSSAPAGTDVVTADADYIDTYNEKYIYSMLMPVKFTKNWEVIVTKSTQKAAKRTVDPMQINPSSKYVVIPMSTSADENDDFNTYVAFDCAEFETAATAAQTDIEYDAPSIIHKWPFRILREIEYGAEGTHSDVALKNVVVEGQTITVVAAATLTIDSNTAFAEGFKIVNKGAIVVKAGADLSNLTIENEGEIKLQNDAILSATVTGKGAITVASDAKASITGTVAANEVNLVDETTGQTILDVTGSLTINKELSIPTENCKFNVKGSGTVTAKDGATVENYGTVNLDGASTVMTVESGAEFIDRIGSHMGGYALKSDNMKVYGEYICEVNTQTLFDDVMAQKKAVVTRIRITSGIDPSQDETNYTLDKNVTDYKSTNVHQTDKQVDLEVKLAGVELKIPNNNTVTFGELIVNESTTITTKTGASSDASKLVLTKNVTASDALTLSDGAKVDVALDVYAKANYTVGEGAVVNVKGDTYAMNGVTIIGKDSKYSTDNLIIDLADVTVETGSKLNVENNLTVYNSGKITFNNNLTAEIGGQISNGGIFTILNAISAQSTTAIVRCAGYSNTGTWGSNNLPIVR